ncbi:MAG: hypothetical protein U5K72_14575 [Balneolaceae bacterium]|nr:hypothetical protein [Balneolaceae bacterium]
MKNLNWYARPGYTIPFYDRLHFEKQLPLKNTSGIQVIWPKKYSRKTYRVEPIKKAIKRYLPLTYFDASHEFDYFIHGGFPVSEREIQNIGDKLKPQNRHDIYGEVIKF